MIRPKMPSDSVRGRIRNWIERHADKLGDDVLEVGSRLHDPAAWWLVNRDLAQGKWTGIDMQEGHGVDMVADIHMLPPGWGDRFSGVLCSEVLEHVSRPWIAVPEIARVVRPGGWIVVTTLLTFHIHGYPSDYWRFTDQGLRLLLEDAGFVDVVTEYGGETVLELKNHEEHVFQKRVPLQIFAVGRRP
jgi:SAM-dependent methyltransferase